MKLENEVAIGPVAAAGTELAALGATVDGIGTDDGGAVVNAAHVKG